MQKTVFAALLCAAAPVCAGNYSTMATFTMVSNCMEEHGGQTSENLYMCSCRADIIQAGMTAEEYEDAITVERYRDLPADKGAVFRDSKKGQDLYAALKKIRSEAEKSCPAIKAVERNPKSITKP